MTERRSEQILLAEMQVLLAQLRTQLSILRAGIGLIAGSVTLVFLLIANQWVLNEFLRQFELPLKGLLAVAIVLGFWRLISAERKIIQIHRLIKQSEKENDRIDEIMV